MYIPSVGDKQEDPGVISRRAAELAILLRVADEGSGRGADGKPGLGGSLSALSSLLGGAASARAVPPTSCPHGATICADGSLRSS